MDSIADVRAPEAALAIPRFEDGFVNMQELLNGCLGLGTFYNDTKLNGGNGTAYSASAYGCARMVIDCKGQAGYLTAAD
jgi:hypothetical protein